MQGLFWFVENRNIQSRCYDLSPTLYHCRLVNFYPYTEVLAAILLLGVFALVTATYALGAFHTRFPGTETSENSGKEPTDPMSASFAALNEEMGGTAICLEVWLSCVPYPSAPPNGPWTIEPGRGVSSGVVGDGAGWE